MAHQSFIEPYSELLAYMCHLKRVLSSENPPADELRAKIENLLAKGEQALKATGTGEDTVRLSRFALCAWIDEMLMNASWKGREQWSRGLLQTKYFQTTNAGEDFFSYLDSIPQNHLALREIYYLCLCLGFKGKYCKPGDEKFIKDLKVSLIASLRSPDSPSPHSQTPLFPEGYPQDLESAQVLGKGPGGLDLPQIVLSAAPPVLFLVLFLIYIFVLKGVTSDILGPILDLGLK